MSDPDKPVKGSSRAANPRPDRKEPRTPRKAPKADWPGAASAVVELAEPLKKAGNWVKAEGLPVRLNTPSAKASKKTTGGGTFEAKVLGRDKAKKAGVEGALITVEAQDRTSAGDVGVSVDYGAFKEAFGGGYASRLTLVELPACALTTPKKAGCRTGEPLTTVNDTENARLTTSAVSVAAGAPTVLAAVASASGQTGDYKATPLAASSTWTVGANTGAFNWTYPIPSPSVPGGHLPNLGISYSSGAIDGRTGNTNNQSSWVGDGFDLSPGFIERRYKSCAEDGVKADDGVSKPGDQCWEYDNAVLTFDGRGGELVPTGANSWKLKKDDGSKIDRLFSTDRANGDNDGEYWRLTAANGTRYYFGYNRLPGWATGNETTDSTWTVPVYGNESGEKCHGATFAESWCQQGWRWNLDYAVDTRGNAIAYYYDKEGNSYGRNLKAADDTPYTRGGTLDRVEYGLKSDAMYSAKALARLDLTSSERCIPNSSTTCSDITKDSFYWYDTPWDLNCTAGTDCDDGRLSPSYWTRKRLTGIATEVWNGTEYKKVDSYKLTHKWGMADTDYQLLLDSIQRTGHTGPTANPTITLPATTLSYKQLANRLDATGDGYAPFIKSRVSNVLDEHGGRVSVAYSDPGCTAGSLPTPETNTTRCFPQLLGGSDTQDPDQEWFNKYVVTAVTAADRVGGAPEAVTSYEYLGGAAWHFEDTDGLTPEDRKTWSDWRGYGQVRMKTGGPGGADAMKTQVDTYYLRGMDGDRLNRSGGTKNVTVTLDEGEGDPITDHESAAGFTYKKVSYSAPGGRVLSKTMERPWRHETARKERSWGTVTANFTGTGSSRTVTALDAEGTTWRTTSVTTTHDSATGLVTQVDDRGDNTTAADNQCTRTEYAPEGTNGILTAVARTETVAVACDATPNRKSDVIADTRYAFDNGAYGAAPTKGDQTAVAVLKSHDGATAKYLESSTTYDSYGRSTSTTDLTADVTVTATGALTRTARLDGLTSTTQYVPTTGWPTSMVTKSPPAKAGDTSTVQTTTQTLDVLRGVPLTKTDTNDKITNVSYDALGRISKVWLPNRTTGTTPTYAYDYFIEDGKPNAVRTLTLHDNGTQLASFTLYDGLLRERQTQTTGPDGGRLISDIFYDERGLKEKTFSSYYALNAPNRDLFQPVDVIGVETQSRHQYDGLGRETEATLIAGSGDGGTNLGTTKTTYTGASTSVVPPEGGVATTTLTDARGKTTELRQHHTRSGAAAYDTTKYAYTPRGELQKVTDPAGNAWSYVYDQMGRQTEASDPDKGVTKSYYDDRGRLDHTTDARGTSLYYAYDQLGRKTELREGSATGTVRAKWTYDTVTGAKGYLAQSSRFSGGVEYTSKVLRYDSLYRPERTAVVIPTSETGIAGTYQSATTYGDSGLVSGVSYSAAGSLPGGSYSYTYDATMRPVSLLGDGFKSSTIYSLTGKPLQYDIFSTAAGAKPFSVKDTYEWGTRRLKSSEVGRLDVPGADRHQTYKYDQTGNVLSVADVARGGTDNQCFTYDYLRRLTDAWTEADTTCGTAPAASQIGGPAPYWESYTYDKVGNRQTETLHDVAGDTAKDVKRTYDYPDPGQARPHTVDSVTQTGPTGSSVSDYTYDATGNTKTRQRGGTTQDLVWDAEGHLSKVTQPVAGQTTGRVTEYLYDAEGNRLIARTPDATTLYVGNTEVVLAKGATKGKATRYIDLGGGHQAVQSDDGSITVTVADHQGTGQLAIKTSDLSMQQRRTRPFGQIRGGSTTNWTGTKTFVGGVDDTADTGLIHLGAREYDQAIGRFISADPLMDLTDPQQINGYAYSSNSPVTMSDPSGLMNADMSSGSGCITRNCSGWQDEAFIGVDLNDDGYVTVYPTVNVDEDWKHLYTYLEVFTGEITDRCGKSGMGLDACSQNLHQPGFSGDLNTSKGVACKAIYDKNCPTETGLGWGMMAQVKDGKYAASWVKGRAGDDDDECAPNSFIPGTLVLMADGSTKPIEDVKNGDQVLATDPETGETVAKTVTAEIRGEGEKHLVKVTIDVDGESGDKTATVTATDGHPFWVPELGKWIDAGDLESSDWLRTSSGTYVQVSAIQRWTARHATVFNLTVSDLHTYYVLAGATPVLVHNSGGCTTVYRGVSEVTDRGDPNPGFDDAVEGIARPRGGDATPEQHHRGNTDSDYTSWTTDPAAAIRAATRGGNGGVVLRGTIPSGRTHVHVNDQPWAEEDWRFEFEVIIQGEMRGDPRAAWPGMRPGDLGFD